MPLLRNMAMMRGGMGGMMQQTCPAWSRPSSSEAPMILTRRRALIGSASLAALAVTRASCGRTYRGDQRPGLRMLRGMGEASESERLHRSVTETDDLEAVKVKLGIPEDYGPVTPARWATISSKDTFQPSRLSIYFAKNRKA